MDLALSRQIRAVLNCERFLPSLDSLFPLVLHPSDWRGRNGLIEAERVSLAGSEETELRIQEYKDQHFWSPDFLQIIVPVWPWVGF